MKIYNINKYEKRNRQLYEKAFDEWKNILIAWEPYTREYIVENAFEIALKQELLTVIHLRKLSSIAVDYLLSVESPLEVMFCFLKEYSNEQLEHLANVVNYNIRKITSEGVKKRYGLCDKRAN